MPRSTSVRSVSLASRAVNLRMGEDVRRLIDRAAQAQGRSRSEFMIAAARRAAEDALLDQTVFVHESEDFKDFMRRLDEPPMPNDALKRMMRTPPPWPSE